MSLDPCFLPSSVVLVVFGSGRQKALTALAEAGLALDETMVAAAEEVRHGLELGLLQEQQSRRTDLRGAELILRLSRMQIGGHGLILDWEGIETHFNLLCELASTSNLRTFVVGAEAPVPKAIGTLPADAEFLRVQLPELGIPVK